MPRRLAPILVAVLGPLAVLALGLVGLERVRTHADEREEANAGRILNGVVLHDDDVVHAMDELLATTEPRVVVLGNSLANTDLRTHVLAEAMGLPSDEVQKLTVPNSMAAHWYAILKNRVYARGHRPELVLVASDLQSLLALAPRSEASHVNLAVQLGPEEPVVDEKLGRRQWFVERVREGRSLLRQDLLDGSREAFAGLVWWRTDTAEGATEAALARVFADDQVDHALHRRVIPVFAEEQPPRIAFDPDELAAPDDGFLPELVALAREHGSAIALVRPPMSPLLPAGQGDVVPQQSEARVPALVAGLGGHWLDLRTLASSPWQFQNVDHMDDEGAYRFSWIVGGLLADELELIGPSEVRGIELLSGHAVEDGRYVARPPRVATPDRPMRLPRPGRATVGGRGASAFFETPTFAMLSDVTTLELGGRRARCSPIRVLEDRATLPFPNSSCDAVFAQGHGRVCHTPDRVIFTASDGSDPVHNPFTYTMALDPDRWCEGGLWTYPFDRASVSGEGELGVGGVSLRLVDIGSTGRGGRPSVSVRVLRGERIVAERTLDVHELSAGATLGLEEPGVPGRELTVELTNPSDHFLLWTSIRLRPAGAPEVESPEPEELGGR